VELARLDIAERRTGRVPHREPLSARVAKLPSPWGIVPHCVLPLADAGALTSGPGSPIQVRVKTTVVSGMLGSGKTTFIGHLLRDARERAVVLVNDFGALGIDGEIFSAGGVEAVELPSGCVCCTLKFDLITTIERVCTAFAPEHLVIEPSGVASPSGVLEALASARVGPVTVVGLVDASEFLELHRAEAYGTFFLDQIVNADVILVNKADLAGEATAAETARVVASLNPGAVVLRTVQAAIDGPLPEARPGARILPGGHAHFRFETLAFRLAAGTPFAALEKLMGRLAAGDHGEVVRAKSLVATDRGPWRFDLAFGSLAAAPFPRPVTESRLVVIGGGLDAEGISRALPASRTS
jgi:G3E family GTPase